MYSLQRLLCLIVALLTASAVQSAIAEKPLDHATFGKLTIYPTDEEPKGIVLLLSGANGWTPELATVAHSLTQLNYVVAGIPLDTYLAQLNRSETSCIDLVADLTGLNQTLEQDYPPPTHLAPILLGLGAGATLSYAALAQATAESFHAAVAVDFCPALALQKPLCKGAANLDSTALADNTGVVLKPVAKLPTTWFVFQNKLACEPSVSTEFIKTIHLARMTEITGTEGSMSWLPQVTALLQWLDPGIVRQVQPDARLEEVPLTEVPATGGPERPSFAVMLSGDGGWALLDRAVTAELAKAGLASVGWDSLSYFWKARQPDDVALDLERVLRFYLEHWKKDRVVLMGHSFGADVLPAIASRLPQDLRERIDLLVFLGLAESAAFEFHLTDWTAAKLPKVDQPVRPELEKLGGLKRLCLYGQEETDPLCPKLADQGVIAEKMPGDDHFDEDYQGIANVILQRLSQPTTSSPTTLTRTPN